MSSTMGPLTIAGREFHSRLILGTGKFASPELMRDALLASGAEMVACGNIGCMTQLAAHLEKQRSKIPVRHTMQVLRDAYARS